MVEPLATRSAQDLMTDPLVEKPMLIEGLMGNGLGFLCASPKTGKSWLAMDISICVATGAPLWGHETQRDCVLHIPLEDTYERLRKRLWLITDEVDGNLSSQPTPKPWQTDCSTSWRCSTKSIPTCGSS